MASQRYHPVPQGSVAEQETFELVENHSQISSICQGSQEASSTVSLVGTFTRGHEADEHASGTIPTSAILNQSNQSAAAHDYVAGEGMGNDIPNESGPIKARAPHAHSKLVQKLSPLTLGTLLLSVLAIIASFAYLCFLWSNPDGAKSNQAWLNTVLAQRVLISITIPSVVIRTAVSAQAM